MKPRNEQQKLVEAQGQTKAKKRRFKIEKLEERIAPHHTSWHEGGSGGGGDNCGAGGQSNSPDCRDHRS